MSLLHGLKIVQPHPLTSGCGTVNLSVGSGSILAENYFVMNSYYIEKKKLNTKMKKITYIFLNIMFASKMFVLKLYYLCFVYRLPICYWYLLIPGDISFLLNYIKIMFQPMGGLYWSRIYIGFVYRLSICYCYLSIPRNLSLLLKRLKPC